MEHRVRELIFENFGLQDLNPIIAGNERCLPSHQFGPAVRSYWLLHFVVSGKGVFRTSRGEYSLGKNDIFVIRPYEITYYEADKSEPWEYMWIGFSSSIPLPMKLLENDTFYAPFLYDIF